VVLKKEQVNVGDPQTLQRLDAFSAPRLVEYFDPNPCDMPRRERNIPAPSAAPQILEKNGLADRSLGVTVEAKFTVGEYDILILSAKESGGLETWLRQNGYKIPKGARELLQPYIRQNLKFFVAKVNLKEFTQGGFQSLRPLQMAYESTRFMLPIRLGMTNSKGEQDLLVYLLSPQGQTELTNYRTVKIPSDTNIPEFVQKEFSAFYKAMFQKSYEREGKRVAFLEYAWDMGSCDPCAAEPLTPDELRKAGVFWSGGRVFLTRLHIRYARPTFPEDLQFQATGNQQFFQGRYVINRPYRGEIQCDAARSYQQQTKKRQEQEAQNLASLTGWNMEQIRQKIDFLEVQQPDTWWRRLWNP
jgi:hypothetical protein